MLRFESAEGSLKIDAADGSGVVPAGIAATGAAPFAGLGCETSLPQKSPVVCPLAQPGYCKVFEGFGNPMEACEVGGFVAGIVAGLQQSEGERLRFVHLNTSGCGLSHGSYHRLWFLDRQRLKEGFGVLGYVGGSTAGALGG